MTRTPLTVGVDVGGTKILAVALRLDDVERPGPPEPVGTRQVPTPDDPEEIVEAIVGAARDASDGKGEAVCVGMGLPGFVGLDGVARQAPNLPALVGRDIGGEVGARLGVPVRTDNDANCAAWAAHRLDAPDARFLVAITFGTGIGGGFVLDGKLLRGAHGFAAEPGHMVVDVDGLPCVCGQRGCWELYASGSALGRLGREAASAGDAPGLVAAAGSGVDAIDGALVGRLAATGDPGASAVMDRYGAWVAVGLANLVNLLDPDVVILGGGVAAEGDALTSRVEAAMGENPTVARGRTTPIRVSTAGSGAGALGAAILGVTLRR